MSILKQRISGCSERLTQFAKKEIESISFSISADLDYKLELVQTGLHCYTISFFDNITKQRKEIGIGHFPLLKNQRDSELFLNIENDLLKLIGNMMFDIWLGNQLQRTKGKKKLAKLIVDENPEFSFDGILELINKNPIENLSWGVTTLIKGIRTKYYHGAILEFEDIVISLE